MKIHWLVCVVATIIFWGAYVPTIHSGQLGFGAQRGPLRAFLFVGLAYFLVAVIVPGVLIFAFQREPADFPTKGMTVSTLAGVLGALGAFGIILALMNGGKPTTVPPLVFAGAPIMSVFVAMMMHPPKAWPQWQFYVGILLAAGGAAMVLKFKPA
ncbi:MAG: hypothetical protein O7F76_03110 [Planctomycetota bacterium]|nr:hypothetical protein [Planctomycetota bacterium]MCZ6697545.1 hypothetical protein [Planctomycetota bacterium]MCZ6815672.1 hypothetical protein [Planctomycetota bacterium]